MEIWYGFLDAEPKITRFFTNEKWIGLHLYFLACELKRFKNPRYCLSLFDQGLAGRIGEDCWYIEWSVSFRGKYRYFKYLPILIWNIGWFYSLVDWNPFRNVMIKEVSSALKFVKCRTFSLHSYLLLFFFHSSVLSVS